MIDSKWASTGSPQSHKSTMRSSSSRQTTGNSSTRSDEIGMDPPMLEAKINRKRAEGDLQLLANRISLLRTEEQKAMGKINETEARAKEILEIKKRNESSLQERFCLSLQKEVAVKEAQGRASSDRELMKSKVSNSRKLCEDNKRTSAAEKKVESKKLFQIAQRVRLDDELEKRKRADDEKKRQEIQRNQRRKEKEDKERTILIEYELRIQSERRKKHEAEELIDVLEREERQLINRLKAAQSLQLKAYTVLQQSFES